MKQISYFIAGILLTAGCVKGPEKIQINACFAVKAWSCTGHLHLPSIIRCRRL